ncbi:MAG: ATP-binding cassette domain-containing protein [Deltaproteobacteria bacterium]|nr:ATP-binding cassette domain-containing protein [Deltaproteobacteria bacterium]
MGLTVNLQRKMAFLNIDVSFFCPVGKIVALVGPSGAGKTTIIRMIAGLENPDGGEIKFSDDVHFNSKSGISLATRKRKLGYVFQDCTLFPHLTVFQNVVFATNRHSEAKKLLAHFSISHLANKRSQEISGGEKQRCAICQALARNPQILLLDEPFSALDVINRRFLRASMKELKRELRCSVIYVTHDINDALSLGDIILPIVDGKVEQGWMREIKYSEHTPMAVRLPKLAIAY